MSDTCEPYVPHSRCYRNALNSSSAFLSRGRQRVRSPPLCGGLHSSAPLLLLHHQIRIPPAPTETLPLPPSRPFSSKPATACCTVTGSSYFENCVGRVYMYVHHTREFLRPSRLLSLQHKHMQHATCNLGVKCTLMLSFSHAVCCPREGGQVGAVYIHTPAC